MPDFSSDCECPNCLEGAQSESDCNPSSKQRGNGSSSSRSRKKFTPSFSRKGFVSECHSTRLEAANKEDSEFLPSKEENSEEFLRKSALNLIPEHMGKKIRPLRELTIQELLREFGDGGTSQPSTMSLGNFRDQVVMKFRRALYYSGIWVAHVQGYKIEKHFSAKYFKRNPGSLHRLVPWLKRELTAVYGDYGYTVKNILSAILHYMTEYDLDSESFIHLLEPYLLQHTHHFLHEFISFVHSPYNMETYDQRAIYQCPSESTFVKKKSIASQPVLPLPEDHVLMTSQHDTKQSKTTQGQCNNEERPRSGLKPFPNGSSSLINSKSPLINHETARKIHVWPKTKSESDDDKGTISANNMSPDMATSRERGIDILNCKSKAQEKKTEGIKLVPVHVQDLQNSEKVECNFSTPEVVNQVQPQKRNIRERKILIPVHQINFQIKEIEKNTCSDSSKIFQKLPRERSLINCKSRKRDPSLSCASEITFSPKRNGRKLSAFRKKIKCRQSSFVETGSHSSRRLRRLSRPRTHRSKSWCLGPRKRSVSRESSNLSLGRSHRSEPSPQNICTEPSKGKNVHGGKSSSGRASSTPVHCVKFSSTGGKRHNCPSKDEGASHTGSPCNSPTCLQVEKHRSTNKSEIKQKNTFPTARRTRLVKHRKNKRQGIEKQTTEEVSDESGSLDELKQMSSHSEHAPSCKRQISQHQNSNPQKGHRTKNEHKRETVSAT